MLNSVKCVSLDLSGCGESFSCATHPSGCSGSDCVAAVTWAYSNDTLDIKMAVSASTGKTNGWVVLGMSDTQSMTQTSCLDCIRNSNDNSITIGYSHNNLLVNTDLATTEGLSGMSSSHVDNELKCSVTRQAVVADAKVFDIDVQTYFVLVAYGPTADSVKWQHALNPIISDTKINLTEAISAEGSVNKLYKVHGCLMIVAWVLFASIGITVARYYKRVWGDAKMCGLDVWFPIHRICQVTAFLLTAIGFVIIFVEKGSFSEFENWTPVSARAHPFLGVIIMALTFINPTMAIFRPSATASKRYIFNWAHWGVGTLTYIAAIVNIFLGFALPSSTDMVPSWMRWLLVGFVVLHVIIELLLEFCKYSSKSRGSMNMEMKSEGEESFDDSSASHIFHKMLLAVYIIAVVGVVIAMVVIIASK
jgi:hypothetical protein